MGLDDYKRKRKFNETPEPAGEVQTKRGNTFVIQKHHATRLHQEKGKEAGSRTKQEIAASAKHQAVSLAS